MTKIVSHETELRLRAYDALLHKWQATINLVAPSTLPQSWQRHFEDSLQIIPLLPPFAQTLYDLGSGAGFPGLVLAIARPNLAVHLIESDQRKGEFLRTVSRETGVAAKIISDRIEVIAGTMPAPDVVTARALKSLPELLAFCAPWIAQNPDLVLILHKGKTAKDEDVEARKTWSYDAVYTPSVTDPEAFIFTLRNIRKV